MPLGGYRGTGGTGRVVSRKQYKHMSFKSGFESRDSHNPRTAAAAALLCNR